MRTPAALLGLPLLALAAPVQAGDSLDVLINEVRVDAPGTDDQEYFELVGTPGLDLSEIYYITLGDGSALLGSGVVEEVTNLTGSSIPASGYFVAAETSFTLGTADLTTTLSFENSDNITHLLVTNFTGSAGDDLDTDDDGVLDSTPWTLELDRIALIEEANPPAATEYHYGPPTVGPDGTFAPGHVFRSPDGANSLTSWNIGRFAFTDTDAHDTPGAANAAPTIRAADGGLQTLVLDGGSSLAGTTYLILASASGTAPGIDLFSGNFPLNYDVATDYSLINANGAVFQNTFGTLGGDGRAYAAVALPTLLPGSVGLTLNTAGVVIDFLPLAIDVLVTNACGVTITP